MSVDRRGETSGHQAGLARRLKTTISNVRCCRRSDRGMAGRGEELKQWRCCILGQPCRGCAGRVGERYASRGNDQHGSGRGSEEEKGHKEEEAVLAAKSVAPDAPGGAGQRAAERGGGGEEEQATEWRGERARRREIEETRNQKQRPE